MGPPMLAWLLQQPSACAWSNGSRVAGWGLAPQWPGRAIAWAILTPMPLGELRAVTRLGRVFLDRQAGAYPRIEASVRPDWEPGLHFLRLMGFQSEGLLRKYDPLGQDHLMYARIRLNPCPS